MADLRIGEPGRHLAQHRGFLDGLGPRTRAVVAKERHRTRLAGPMARLAILLQDWQDILVECDRSRRQIGREGRQRHEQYGGKTSSHPQTSGWVAPPPHCREELSDIVSF